MHLEGPRKSNVGLTSGDWDLGKHADWDYLYGNLWRRLDEVHADGPLAVLALESAGTNFKTEAALMIVLGLAVVAMAWANVNGVSPHDVHNKTMKKHATGSGNAEKEDILKAATRLGWEPPSEHAADALFVLDLALTQRHRR